MRHELCKLSDIPDQGSRVLPFFGREIHVWKDASGRPRAAANACLHFGGPLERKEGRLVCPWHGASYDMDSGQRVEGPGHSGARLMFLSTRAEGDGFYYVWGEAA